MKTVAERLKIDYSRFMDVEIFTKFGAHIEEETARLIRRGERLREILKQPLFHSYTLEDEIISFFILESGVLDKLEIPSVEKHYKNILYKIKQSFPNVLNRIKQEGRFAREDKKKLKDFITSMEGAS